MGDSHIVFSLLASMQRRNQERIFFHLKRDDLAEWNGPNLNKTVWSRVRVFSCFVAWDWWLGTYLLGAFHWTDTWTVSRVSLQRSLKSTVSISEWGFTPAPGSSIVFLTNVLLWENRFCRWLDFNLRHLVQEANTQSTVPLPQIQHFIHCYCIILIYFMQF